eukprot:1933731-Rhodomonas_salina.1
MGATWSCRAFVSVISRARSLRIASSSRSWSCFRCSAAVLYACPRPPSCVSAPRAAEVNRHWSKGTRQTRHWSNVTGQTCQRSNGTGQTRHWSNVTGQTRHWSNGTGQTRHWSNVRGQTAQHVKRDQ